MTTKRDKKRILWSCIVAGVIGLGVILGGWWFSANSSTPDAPSTPRYTAPDQATLEHYKPYKMIKGIIHTEKGDMYVDFYAKETPITVANFCKLAEAGFYDGLTFHRVIPDFVIQGGCPLGTGAGGPGYTIPCETSADKQYHDRGVLSMAHRGKNTGGSQFFICMSRTNTAHLDGVHTCFGRVTKGLEVIDQIRQGDLILGIDIIKEEE